MSGRGTAADGGSARYQGQPRIQPQSKPQPRARSQSGSRPQQPSQPQARSQSQWYDEDAGPLVRLYAVTGGRARADERVFSLLTLVVAQSGPYDDPALGPEQVRVLALCRGAPQSVAEIAARCDLPLGVTRVLLSDLLAIGHIRVRQPAPPADVFDERILQEVIDGLRAL